MPVVPNRPVPVPKRVTDYIQDLSDMLDGIGRHAGHIRTQVGRCVHCDCGARVQGRMTK